MKAWLSRYRPVYIATLIYMLQHSEYNPAEYLQWLHRTRNFAKVQQRKKLVRTPKANLLLGIAWALVVMFGALVVLLALDRQWLGALLVALLAPWILPYLLLVPLEVGFVTLQRLQERQINARTTNLLRATGAYKIAIAGSYGKTTMKELLATVLGVAKEVATTPGNHNTPIGISRFVAALSGKEEVLIFELGEYYPGDIAELSQIVQPDMGVITGVNEAHLEKFKTLERTTATIFELADYLGDRPVYVNGESPLAVSRVASGQHVYTATGVQAWRVDPKTIQVDLDGVRFTVSKGSKQIKAHSALLGAHTIGPLAAVIAIADSLGLTSKQIETGVANTKPFEHRLELKRQADGVILIDDTYNGNPDGARVAINFLRDLRGHRRVYVTPGLVEVGARTAEVHREIGRQLAGAVEMVLLMRNSVSSYIEAGLQEGGFKGEVRFYPTSLEAIQAVPSITKAGDVVVLQNDWGDSYA